MSYQRLDGNSIPLSRIGDENIVKTSEEQFKIKVLCKEKSYNIENLNQKSTISDLKNAIASTIEVPYECQRLIFNGKQLVQDDKTLDAYGIREESVIHLFPRLQQTQSASACNIPTGIPVNRTSGETLNPIHDGSTSISIHSTPILSHQSMIYDPYVTRSGNEVKMWSYVLLLTSSLRLFGILSTLFSTGNLNPFCYYAVIKRCISGSIGINLLDSFVQGAELVCSATGLYVGRLGVQSVHTLEISVIKRYVYFLCGLAAVSILNRFFWVADVIVMAEQARREQQENGGNDDTNAGGGGTGGGGAGGSPGNVDFGGHLDKQAVALFGMQAAVIAAIAATIWLSCVSRALRFQQAVSVYTVVPTPAAPAATPPVVAATASTTNSNTV